MRTISFRLPDYLLKRLEEASRSRRISKSRIVRECLEKQLGRQCHSQEVTCYDLAKDLAGCIKGLPRDLATNPRHMDEFGK